MGLRDLLDGPSGFQRQLGLEALEVREQEQVGLIPRCDRTEMPETVPRGGVDRRQHDRVLRRDARSDRLPDHAIDVAVRGDVLRIAVVGAEGDAVRPELLHERQQRLQVARHRRFANQKPHAGTQPLASLVGRQRFVVRPDACRDVGVQLFAEQTRRVAVDLDAFRQAHLLQLGVVTVHDAREIHHLGKPEHTPPPEQALEVAAQQRAAR